jgi:hypothetical protein
VVRLIEQAFNAAHPKQQIFLRLLDHAIEIEPKGNEKGRPNDTCQ